MGSIGFNTLSLKQYKTQNFRFSNYLLEKKTLLSYMLRNKCVALGHLTFTVKWLIHQFLISIGGNLNLNFKIISYT